MRKFLLKIGLHLILILCGFVIAVYVGSTNYWRNRIPVIKAKCIPRSQDSVTVLLGNSHVFFGFNSKYISGQSINLASISQSYYEDYFILKSLCNTSKIKQVILPLSYFSNYLYLSNVDVEGEYMRVFDYEKAYGMSYPWNKKYWDNKVEVTNQIIHQMIEPILPRNDIDSSGNYLDACIFKTGQLGDSVTSFIRHHKNHDFRSIHPYLDSMIVLCKLHQIPLHVMIFPTSQGYRNQIKKYDTSYNVFLQQIAHYAKGRFQFYNFSEFIKQNESIYFNDSDHLSPCGRDTFSAHVAYVLEHKVK